MARKRKRAFLVGGALFFMVSIAGSLSAQETPTILITRIQVGGATAKDEFVEITNTSDESAPLLNWRLSRATTGGTISNLLTSFPETTLAPHATFRIAHPEFTGSADLTFSTNQSIAANNSIILYSDQGETISNLVGMGSASMVEGNTTENPPDNDQLVRKKQNNIFQDTHNNRDDFSLASRVAEEAVDEPEETEPEIPQTLPGIIRLSEIFPAPPEDKEEWIELDISRAPVDTEGWTLADGARVIHTFEGTLNPGFLVISFTRTLNNTGDIIVLKNNAEEIIQQITWGAWDDGNREDNAPNPGAGESLIAQDAGFVLTTTPTRGSANVLTAPAPPPAPAPSPTPQSPAPAPAPAPAARPRSIRQSFLPDDVVINEIYPAPRENEQEWVELFDRTSEIIDLNGWTIEEGAERVTRLEGVFDPRIGKTFLLIDDMKGSLNNTGDTVVLKDPSGQIIDRVTYGNWGSTPEQNAPRASTGASIARVDDGLDSSRFFDDFGLSFTPTPGAPNVITQNEQVQREALTISEVYPNPPGDDALEEFIELYNQGDAAVPLAGWMISDSTDTRALVSRTTKLERLAPHSYLVLARKDTHIALNNSGGETILLFPPDTPEASDRVTYSETAQEGWSYARIESVFQWTQHVTPGVSNVLRVPNRPPVARIDALEQVQIGEPLELDASDATDPDGDSLTYHWAFPLLAAEGVRVVTVFDTPGEVAIALTVRDAEGLSDTISHTVLVEGEAIVPAITTHEELPLETVAARLPEISEVLPNPAGRDDGEFIELYNPHDEPIVLKGLKLDDAPGGSGVWAIPDDILMTPHEYLVFWRDDTRIVFNNTGDSVRLLNANDTELIRFNFGPARDDEALILVERTLRAAAYPTPGEPNVIEEPKGEKTDAPKESNDAQPRTVTAEEIAALPRRAPVTLEGIVIAPTGRFGNSFYLDGIKVEYGETLLTALAIGDRVRITGTTAMRAGEPYVRITEPGALELLGHEEAADPRLVTVAELDEAHLGHLVRIEGTLVRRVGRNVYLADENGEVRAYLGQHLTATIPSVKESPTLSLTGIVSRTDAGFRILPRSDADIIVSKVHGEIAALEAMPSENTPQPLVIQSDVRTRTIAKILLGGGALLALALCLVHYGKKET